ncbi:MAG TPA: redoxin domain-containing protein [Actinomycetota bacterium]|jgi:peroxiredoxin|nr:redoxin domain-containing protein [Actinomycetota bacterium]
MTIRVGERAPDFELPGRRDPDSREYEMHRLSKELTERPVILHFFPAPFTSTCERQMCAVRDEIDLYAGAGVTVWGVTGHYPQMIAAWAKEHHFGVPILADYEHEVSERYVGTYPPELFGGLRHMSKRAVVAVGQDGAIRYAWVADVSSEAPSDEVVAKALASLKS